MSATLLATSTGCCDQSQQLIDKPEFTSTDGIFNIEALEALGRVSNPKVSPDGTKILYGISYESVEQNKSNNELYVMNIDGSGQKRLTTTPMSENDAVRIDGGRRIECRAEKNGKPQMRRSLRARKS